MSVAKSVAKRLIEEELELTRIEVEKEERALYGWETGMRVTKGQEALLAVSSGAQTCDGICNPVMFHKARVIVEAAPDLVDDVLDGLYTFDATYREALRRKYALRGATRRHT